MAELTPQSITFPIQFIQKQTGEPTALVLFPNTSQYIECSHVALRDLYVQLDRYLHAPKKASE